MTYRNKQSVKQLSMRSCFSAVLVCGGAVGFQYAVAENHAVHSGVELGVGAHFTEYDVKDTYTTAEGALIQLGYRFDNPFSIELLHSDADHDPRGLLTGELETNHTLFNVLYHYRAGSKMEPYVGIGAGRFDVENGLVSNEESSVNMSVGLKYHFSKYFTLRPEIGYRNVSGDVNDEFFDVNIIISAVFGGGASTMPAEPDPESEPVVEPEPVVEAEPVPAPLDSDQDGVVDSEDQCPDSPLGETVDAQGCAVPKDTDGDGVIDREDECADTPAGVAVDAMGCKIPPKDTDGDGVFDDVDQCPDTAENLKVDDKGCAKRLVEKVSIRLDIKFDSNSAAIKSEHTAEIQKIATFLQQYAGTVVRVEGHTDTRGRAQYNKSLSQKRADAVAKVLVESMQIAADRVTAVGLGEEQPIADDATAQGRETNRRVVAEISLDVEKFERL